MKRLLLVFGLVVALSPLSVRADMIAVEADSIAPPPPTGLFTFIHALVDSSTSTFYPQGPGPFDYVFDGVAETAGAHTLTNGVIPVVTESITDLGNGKIKVSIWSASPTGTDLFPGGYFGGGNPLDSGGVVLGGGGGHALDFGGPVQVVQATLSLTRDGVIILGPFDVTGFFANPWDGSAKIILLGKTDRGINDVHLDIVVMPEPASVVLLGGACLLTLATRPQRGPARG